MTTYIRNSATVLLLVMAFALTAIAMPVHAQETDGDTDSSSIESMLAQIQTLIALIESLQEQLNQVRDEVKDILRDGLKEGVTDDDVSEIQELLASDSNIYPEGLVTGYYGPLTTRALARLQRCAGIRASGELDTETQEVIEAFLSGDNVNRRSARDLCKVLRNEVDDSDDANDDDDSDDDSDVHLNRGSNVKVCHRDRKTISVGGLAARAHLAHGDTLGRCDEDSDDDGNDDSDEANDDDSDDDSDEANDDDSDEANDDDSDDDSDEANDDDSDDDSDEANDDDSDDDSDEGDDS